MAYRIRDELQDVDLTMFAAALNLGFSENTDSRFRSPSRISRSRTALGYLAFVPLKLEDEGVISSPIASMRQGIAGISDALTSPLLENPSLDDAIAGINEKLLWRRATKAARDILTRPLRLDRLLYELSGENPVLFFAGEQAEMYAFEEGMEDPDKQLFLAGVATVGVALNAYDRTPL